MTNLTEQWKKGKLPEGHYYVKDGENMIAEYLDGYFYNDGNPMTSFSGGVDSVLAPVPSYEEWEQLKEYERIVTSYNMKPIDYDIACETVNKLLDDNKRLKHDVGNLGYKIKNQRHEIDNRLKEIEKLKETNEALKSELKEVCDVLIRKYPEMKDWVMLNWKHLYEVQDDN